jgi:hypothetical protein
LFGSWTVIEADRDRAFRRHDLRRTYATNEGSNDNGLRAWLGDDPM